MKLIKLLQLSAVLSLLFGAALGTAFFCQFALQGPDTPTALPPSPSLHPLRISYLPTETPSSSPSPSPSFTVSPSPSPSFTLSPSPSPSLSLTPAPLPSLPPPSPESSPSPLPSPLPCQGREGWVQHSVQAGETLFAFQLGVSSAVTVDEIIAANCLAERWIYEGQVLWLPPGAAANAPSSESIPTPLAADPDAPPPPPGLTRSPACPCTLSIRAGWRLEQIADAIDSLPVGFRGSDFLAVARRGGDFAGPLFLNGMPAGASLEGYLFPGDYLIQNDTDARALVRMALDQFGAAVPADWWTAAAGHGFSPYQAVTLASIINRESRSYNQQVLIASVFHNRLKSNRGLGATVTTQYAVGGPGNWWPSVQGIISTYDSPYNTNLYQGLPPTPISSPGLEALQAAIFPAQSNYLFFTASCEGGGNAFAETYEQHLKNVRCEP